MNIAFYKPGKLSAPATIAVVPFSLVDVFFAFTLSLFLLSIRSFSFIHQTVSPGTEP